MSHDQPKHNFCWGTDGTKQVLPELASTCASESGHSSDVRTMAKDGSHLHDMTKRPPCMCKLVRSSCVTFPLQNTACLKTEKYLSHSSGLHI
jgi:hypothetical protein